MTISVTCECGKRLAAPDRMAGRRAKCPKCGHVVTIPEPEPEPDIYELAEPREQEPPARTGGPAASEGDAGGDGAPTADADGDGASRGSTPAASGLRPDQLTAAATNEDEEALPRHLPRGAERGAPRGRLMILLGIDITITRLIVLFVLLVLVGVGVWYFAYSGDGEQGSASGGNGGGQKKAGPANMVGEYLGGIARTHEMGQNVGSTREMKQIFALMEVYRSQHGDWPDRLDQLESFSGVSSSMLAKYLYEKPARQANESETVILRERHKQTNPDGPRLYMDGHVEGIR